MAKLSNDENRRHTAQPWATWASGRAVMGFAGRLGAIAVSRLWFENGSWEPNLPARKCPSLCAVMLSR
jgi:hypothetical protein